MTTGIRDPQVTPKPALWKVILNVIYSGLGVLKGMGMFSKKAGPR